MSGSLAMGVVEREVEARSSAWLDPGTVASMMAIVRGPTPLARRGHSLSIAGRVGIIPRQSRCQIRSGRRNAKFSIDVTQVKLDRFGGHEELAGDLARG